MERKEKERKKKRKRKEKAVKIEKEGRRGQDRTGQEQSMVTHTAISELRRRIRSSRSP